MNAEVIEYIGPRYELIFELLAKKDGMDELHRALLVVLRIKIN